MRQVGKDFHNLTVKATREAVELKVSGKHKRFDIHRVDLLWELVSAFEEMMDFVREALGPEFNPAEARVMEASFWKGGAYIRMRLGSKAR
jgi:hypothetical protein